MEISANFSRENSMSVIAYNLINLEEVRIKIVLRRWAVAQYRSKRVCSGGPGPPTIFGIFFLYTKTWFKRYLDNIWT